MYIRMRNVTNMLCSHFVTAQLAGAVEYANYIFAEKSPGYDTKQSDGEAPVLEF